MEEIAEWSPFPAATVLVVDPLSQPQSRDYVLVCKRGNEKPTLRQIIIDGDDYYLKSPLVALENKIVPMSKEWEILGTIKEITYKKV